ncbi:protein NONRESPONDING TO OXYLIPINS 2, mitochondrial isoform X2 [Rhodamnia argentea]|uniref:Protein NONRESPONDING TO OXYLIPINS 2, mitochondrial isoform X2 n=1 Tax=Rhodamnia argentea TaxID=178133 RepID=A0A8B8NR22_9MYRT|nr:protein NONRESPONDING TO OXYLIPINS 2, mitochondrial isoform X2 [Rhodamnia argentea]
MASACNRAMQRASTSLGPALRSSVRTSPQLGSASSRLPLPTRSTSSPLRCFFSSRLPAELACVQSLLPLHSAVSAARLTSCLSTTSRSCRALSQDGIDGT